MNKIEESRLRKLKETENTIKMYENTLEEMKDKDNFTYSEIEDLLNDYKKRYELLKTLSKEDFKTFSNYSGSVEEFKKYLENKRNIVKNNRFSESLKIKEPFRKNNFLVYLPEEFDISPDEIVSFMYNEGIIQIRVREICGKRQIKKLIELMKKTSVFPVIYVEHLSPSLKVEYIHFYKDITLINYFEEELTYEIKEDNNLRFFTLTFNFKNHFIK